MLLLTILCGDDKDGLGGQVRGFVSKQPQFRTFGTTTTASQSGQKAGTTNRRLKPLKSTNAAQKMVSLPLHQSTLVFGSRIRERARIGKNGSTIPGNNGQGSSPGGSGFGSGMPGGISEPGADNTPPPFGDQGGGNPGPIGNPAGMGRSEEHTSELQSH